MHLEIYIEWPAYMTPLKPSHKHKAEWLAEIPLHVLIFLDIVKKISEAFLQTGCPFTHATNSVKALKEAILSPGPYSK